MTEQLAYDSIMVADLETMANANNYRRWIYNRISPFIGQRILEVGAGIGNFTSLLLDRQLVVASDKYDKCLDYLNGRIGGKPNLISLQLDLAAPDFNVAKYNLDTIICLNVLEHIEDDVASLRFMHSVLAANGRAIILVPAFQFLHGSVDRAIGHYRRYTRSTLLPRMREAGFSVEQSFYMNVIGMAGWFWNNRIRRIEQEEAGPIEIFDKLIAPWAQVLERLVPPPLGLSLIAIGHKT